MGLNYDMDALDCLLILGYKIVREKTVAGQFALQFRLSDVKADWKYRESIALLLKEVEETKEYYGNRIIELGKAML